MQKCSTPRAEKIHYSLNACDDVMVQKAAIVACRAMVSSLFICCNPKIHLYDPLIYQILLSRTY